jgi:hypothetical protein
MVEDNIFYIYKEENQSDNFTLKQNYIVLSPVDESAYTVSFTNWDRIKKLVDNIPTENNLFQHLLSLCIGVFFSSVFFLFSLLIFEDVPVWLYIVTWVLVSCSFLGSVVYVRELFVHKKLVEASKALLNQEFLTIEQSQK